MRREPDLEPVELVRVKKLLGPADMVEHPSIHPALRKADGLGPFRDAEVVDKEVDQDRAKEALEVRDAALDPVRDVHAGPHPQDEALKLLLLLDLRQDLAGLHGGV